MIYTKNTVSTILTIAVMISFCGCLLPCSNRVVIDKQFLCDIEQEFQREALSGKDRGEEYNHIWKYNFEELIYLASKGDHKAIKVGILLIGQHAYPVGRFERFELFAVPTVKSDPNYFWEALEEVNPEIQSMALYRLHDILPSDRIDCFLNTHPKVKIFLHEHEVRGDER